LLTYLYWSNENPYRLSRGTGFAQSAVLNRGKGNVKSELVTLVSAIFIFSSGSSLLAATPKDEIRAAVTEAVQILKEPSMKSQRDKQNRLEKLERIVDPIFDFQEMAKRSLGLHWRELTPEEQQEFVPLFREFLGKVYLDRMTSHDVEKVVFTHQTSDNDFAEPAQK
jgi:phospholipid transport system substrate-binding protein